MNKKDFEDLKAAVAEMVEIERGRRKMPAMARNLMYIAERHPKVILELAR